jgi:hypothetical protein
MRDGCGRARNVTRPSTGDWVPSPYGIDSKVVDVCPTIHRRAMVVTMENVVPTGWPAANEYDTEPCDRFTPSGVAAVSSTVIEVSTTPIREPCATSTNTAVFGSPTPNEILPESTEPSADSFGVSMNAPGLDPPPSTVNTRLPSQVDTVRTVPWLLCALMSSDTKSWVRSAA